MGEHSKPRRRFDALPHPAFVCSGPQLDQVIGEMEAGTIPKPDEGAVWRDDLPLDVRQRLARVTGATEEMITKATAEDRLKWEEGK